MDRQMNHQMDHPMDHQMTRPMTRQQKVGIVVAITGVSLFVTLVFALTYWLTSVIFERLGVHPAPFTNYIIDVLFSQLFCFLILTTLGRIWGSKQRILQAGVFGAIFEAMARIAKGDFSVTLADTHSERGIVGEISRHVNNMAAELNQIELMRQEFISNVSHEIQSPLTSIRGFATALQADQLSTETRKHYLDIIETECTRLSRITENLLRLATLEAKHTRIEPKPYRLDKQIRKLILACEPQWTSKAIQMEVSLEEIETVSDEDLLSQVWTNLIHNSIKFSPQASTIHIDLSRQGDKLEFKITDQGMGISEADQARIFERFYKADRSRIRTDHTGSGLGLSIVQKIVEMHNGTIAVESNPGTGTTFLIILPVLQEAANLLPA